MAEVFWVALLTDLATGLGVIPFAFMKNPGQRWSGVTTAVAAGMMLSASLFALADKALRMGRAIDVIAGMLAGSKPEAAWGVTAGLVAMLGFTAALGV